LRGNHALLGRETKSDESLGELAIGLFADEFVARLTPPKINAGTLKEFARSAAEKLDERRSMRAMRSPRGNPQEEFLECLIGITVHPDVDRGIASRVQRIPRYRQTISLALISD
jgi:hypothetical protein